MTAKLEYKLRLPRDLGGQKIAVAPRSDIRFLSLSIERVDHDLLSAARALVKPGDVVWDIGANLGVFAFASAFKAGRTGRVIAVEPDAYHIRMIEKSSKLSPPESAPVEILNAAISADRKPVQFNLVARGHAKNYIAESEGFEEAGEVTQSRWVMSTTLDAMLESFPSPNVLKIDIEGAELLALRSGNELLKRVRPLIYIEVFDRNQDQATKILKNAGYVLKVHHGNGFIESERCAFNTFAQPLA